jgi:hypothetical protein
MGEENIMEILDVIAAKRNLAQRVLQDLLQNYKNMDDTQRLEKANTILDEINSYLQIEENLLFPFIQKGEQSNHLLEKMLHAHGQIEYVMEHTIMMHVDEPSGEFWQGMARLSDLIYQARQADEETVFPWCEAHLSEADQYYIAINMKNQMTHESLPSSGMTIY